MPSGRASSHRNEPLRRIPEVAFGAAVRLFGRPRDDMPATPVTLISIARLALSLLTRCPRSPGVGLIGAQAHRPGWGIAEVCRAPWRAYVLGPSLGVLAAVTSTRVCTAHASIIVT